MKKLISKQTRSIWTENERNYLVHLLREDSSMSWIEVAKALNAKFNTSKTGKQCRERYRNYENPGLKKDGWKQSEKALFIVMHKVYGNQWSNISRYLNSRSDVVIKNYFYCQMRKTTKNLKQMRIPVSLLKKPEKFYLAFIILRRIRDEYLPEVERLETMPKYGHKERIILNLLVERKVTQKNVEDYMLLMLSKFKEFHSVLPIVIPIFLDQFSISSQVAKDLILKDSEYNAPPLSQIIVVKAYYSEKEFKVMLPVLTGNQHTVESCEHPQIPINTFPHQALVYWNQTPVYQNTFVKYPFFYNPLLLQGLSLPPAHRPVMGPVFGWNLGGNAVSLENKPKNRGSEGRMEVFEG
eukprot:TRINITY_DN867_c0_g1_i9.p1 TRINITY_DN867_c0_g1~~TRINITY_DN867_c0_g1_i9.p1  ORF type:complete len:353 (-),score=65.44 TRINITY_DN867_c0_g1_i9:93-1151(-)